MDQKTPIEKKAKVEFIISRIDIFNFQLNNSPEYRNLSPDHLFTFEINTGILADTEKESIGIDFKINVFTDMDKKYNVCELVLRMTFRLKNFKEVVSTDKIGILIPDPLLSHLIAMTISTARGIFFEKVQGSFLSNIILPPVNVSKLNKIELAKVSDD